MIIQGIVNKINQIGRKDAEREIGKQMQNEYQKERASVIDRVKALQCPNCGGMNKILDGMQATCKYCGSLIEYRMDRSSTERQEGT